MPTFSTSIRIRAKRDAIWSILTDAPSWTEWNPTIDEIEGSIAPGEKVTVRAKASPGRAFPLKVTEFVPGERMVWSGGMPLGLFTGERTYTLEERPDGSVEFAMEEGFRGLLAPLITRSIPDLQPSFDAFGRALKARAERDA